MDVQVEASTLKVCLELRLNHLASSRFLLYMRCLALDFS